MYYHGFRNHILGQCFKGKLMIFVKDNKSDFINKINIHRPDTIISFKMAVIVFI